MRQIKDYTVKEIHPNILYYGTPVVLLTTLNEDETVNISPISSSWALGNYVVLGLSRNGQAIVNLERHRECVINIPDPSLWENVERLACFTGKEKVPKYKQEMRFSYKKEKISSKWFNSCCFNGCKTYADSRMSPSN
ncbi:hypothetical protein GCM10011391_19300 [Pullulanibacillus camelliae]|uniref:Flavin reductase like domain-containing protein n=1 Tax=Pullulanibacillus camelliae TaxID=1707096 RepID=A0A8J2YDQ3_9BACL|nr:hypothetical protein GCM10011391_19300 [Pullulanibacillus camelliae]